jgi:hypothetical protein
MGGEAAPLFLFIEALYCLPGAALFWRLSGREKLPYTPLLVGSTVSMVGLAPRAYVQSLSDYLPGRFVVFDAIVELLVVLPLICFVVVPLTAGLARRRCLTLRAIGLCVLIGWVALSLVGWLLHLWWLSNHGLAAPPDANGKFFNGKFLPEGVRDPDAYPLSYFLKSAVVPALIYGLPIPLTALGFFRRGRAPAEGGQRSQ